VLKNESGRGGGAGAVKKFKKSDSRNGLKSGKAGGSARGTYGGISKNPPLENGSERKMLLIKKGAVLSGKAPK